MHRYPISNNRSNQSQHFLKKFYIIGKTFYFYRSTALKNTHIKLKMYKFITGMSNFFIFSSSICFLSSKVLTKNCQKAFVDKSFILFWILALSTLFTLWNVVLWVILYLSQLKIIPISFLFPFSLKFYNFSDFHGDCTT